MATHGWVRVSMESGGETEEYYMHTETRETTWTWPDAVPAGEEIPLYGRSFNAAADDDEKDDKEAAPEPEGDAPVSAWVKVLTQDGEAYYMHKETRETTWDLPDTVGKIETYGRRHGESSEDEDEDEDEDEEDGDGGVGRRGDVEPAPAMSPATAISRAMSAVEDHVRVAGEVDEIFALLGDDAAAAADGDDGDDGASAAAASADAEELAPGAVAGTLLLPPRTPRRRSAKPKYQCKELASMGTDEAGVYYLHLGTGETFYEEPADFVAYDGEVAYTGAALDPEMELEDQLAAVGLNGAEAEAQRDAMLRGEDEDGAEAGERFSFSVLQTLLKVMQEYGSEDEWAALIAADSCALVGAIAAYWGTCTSADVRVLVCRLLRSCIVFYDDAAPALVAALEPEGGATVLWRHMEQGLAEAGAQIRSEAARNRARPAADSVGHAAHSLGRKGLLHWTGLLGRVVVHPAVDRDLKAAAMPSESAVLALLRTVEHAGESADMLYDKIATHATRALLAISGHGSRATPPNDVIIETCRGIARRAAAASSSSSSSSTRSLASVGRGDSRRHGWGKGSIMTLDRFLEQVLRALNGLSFPVKDMRALVDVIGFVRALLTDKPTSEGEGGRATGTAGLLSQNNLKVVIDICVREIRNLSPELRVYLDTLRLLLLNSNWKHDDRRYRARDILKCVHELMDAAALDKSFYQGTEKRCRRLLEECIDLLDP